MKKFFALVLALVMVMGLTTVAWGATTHNATPDNYNSVLSSAVSGDTIKLTGGHYPTLYFGADGLTIEGGEGVTVGQVKMQDTPGYNAPNNLTLMNITFVGDADSEIEGVVGSQAGTAFNNLKVIECNFTNGARIDINGQCTTDGLLIQGCTFEATAANTSTIRIAGDAKNITILKNTIANAGYNAIQIPDTVSGTVEISDNTISSTADRAIRLGAVQSGATLTITGNTVTNGTDADGEVMKATSIADGVVVNAWNNDWDGGTVVNAELKDSNAALYDLYEGDDDLYVGGTIRTKVAAKKLTKTQAGQVAGWDIEGTLYVEITKAEATNGDYYLTNHGKDKAILYLREAENHGVYTLTGKAYDNYNEGDDNCGEWNFDPELVAMYKDDVDGDIYTDMAATAYMLVGKTVVGVALADEDAYMVDHQMEGVYNAKDVLVGVKCVVCGATGKVYESVAKVPFGADYDFFDDLPYVLNKVAVKPGTDTKVESAETFDAGIAMYVGMSVMAAAGSAVVIGKKKD